MQQRNPNNPLGLYSKSDDKKRVARVIMIQKLSAELAPHARPVAGESVRKEQSQTAIQDLHWGEVDEYNPRPPYKMKIFTGGS